MRQAFFTVPLILANLLVPQRVVTYRACCYDVAGHLRADMPCQARQRSSDGAGASLQGPLGCCAPLERILRPAPAPEMNSAPKIARGVLFGAPLEAVSAGPALHVILAVDTPVAFGTGPPGAPGLLTLHSRLNL